MSPINESQLLKPFERAAFKRDSGCKSDRASYIYHRKSRIAMKWGLTHLMAGGSSDYFTLPSSSFTLVTREASSGT
jgi:hypothetical protein